MLRYDLEEAACFVTEPCACGETTKRGFWGGRFKDLLSSQGKHFQVNEVEGALRTVPQVNEPTLEWQVIKPSDADAPLHVRVELGSAGGNESDVAAACVGAIAAEVGVRAVVEVVSRGSLERHGYRSAWSTPDQASPPCEQRGDPVVPRVRVTEDAPDPAQHFGRVDGSV
jgi:phenylacetate-CoA ligase